jgi:hypothetical protein
LDIVPSAFFLFFLVGVILGPTPEVGRPVPLSIAGAKLATAPFQSLVTIAPSLLSINSAASLP